MITPPRRLIRQRRERLGIGMDDLARRIGVSISEYRDLELYDRELPEVLPLEKARSLAAIFASSSERCWARVHCRQAPDLGT